MLAVESSTKLPGATLLATVNVGPRIATIYSRFGDLLGWICFGAFVVLLPWSIVRARRPRSTVRFAI
jgi:hypothetical protein